MSYTTFAYDGIFAQPDDDGEGITVIVGVTNTGSRRGREVVQAYVAVPESAVQRVPQALGGFGSVTLEPGERAELEIHIDRRDLEYRDTRTGASVLEPGRYVVAVGASSRDLRGSTEVELEGEEVRVPLTLTSTLAEAMASPVVAQAIGDAMGAVTGGGESGGAGAGDALGVDLAAMMGSIPLDRLVGFSSGAVTTDQLQQLLDAANEAH